MKLLHLDSSILGEHSVSRVLSAAIVAQLKKANPELEETYRDLAAEPIAHLSGTYLAAAQGHIPSPPPELVADLADGGAALEAFLAADIVVIGVGLYNFTVPSQLKAWVDRILVAGKTFKYGEAGPVGLAGGKRVILALARGGFYGAGAPAAPFEHGETYLRAVFGFIGITDLEFIVAEGVATGPAQKEKAVAEALAQIATLAVG